MRSQLIHLLALCIVLSVTGFARANDDAELRGELERLFGETNEPLEPEEAKKLITHNWDAFVRGYGSFTDIIQDEKFRSQAKLLKDLADFEEFSAKCNWNGFSLVREVAQHIDKLPALKDYFEDRRNGRLLESCSNFLKDRLREYIDRNDRRKGRPSVGSILESLRHVPAEVILGENWLEKKNDQVSAALYDVTKKQRHFFKDFKGQFDGTVVKVCQGWPTLPGILPYYMETNLVGENKIDLLDQLDQSAVNRHKLLRLCASIRDDPVLAFEIVSDYKNKQKLEKRAEKEPQRGCL